MSEPVRELPKACPRRSRSGGGSAYAVAYPPTWPRPGPSWIWRGDTACWPWWWSQSRSDRSFVDGPAIAAGAVGRLRPRWTSSLGSGFVCSNRRD